MAILKLRSGSYSRTVLARRKRAERAFTSVVATCYLLGVIQVVRSVNHGPQPVAQMGIGEGVADGAAVFQLWYVRGRPAWVVIRRNYPMSESEASARITGISGGFIGTLRLSERPGKNRMVCTIAHGRGRRAGELGAALATSDPMLPAVTPIPTSVPGIAAPPPPGFQSTQPGPDTQALQIQPFQHRPGSSLAWALPGPGECDSRRHRERGQGDEDLLHGTHLLLGVYPA